MTDLRKILELDRYPDLNESVQGLLAGHRPNIGILSYDVQFNAPLESESDICNQIVEFAKPANEAAVRGLFGLCNGAHIGKFLAIYGFSSETTQKYMCTVSWDIVKANTYGRLAGLPKDWFVVAQSGLSLNEVHLIDETGNFVVVEEGNPSAVVRNYETVIDWIKTEFNFAIESLNDYYSGVGNS
ncbi:MAG: hypothetical protein ABJT31_05715 [Hyphomicrobiales bacterium]